MSSDKKSAKAKSKSSKSKDTDFTFLGSKDDSAESRTVKSRARLRKKIEDDIKSFLKDGGCIQQIANNITADPPVRPAPKYGGRPI